jgi:hypothetical protein
MGGIKSKCEDILITKNGFWIGLFQRTYSSSTVQLHALKTCAEFVKRIFTLVMYNTLCF